MSIGMWDSGVGGLTVMREVKRVLPAEKVIYFGDTARVPYGGKSGDTILRYSIENSVFLMQQNLKMLIIACNTACSYAHDQLQKMFHIPVLGVIEPAAQKAVQITRNKRIGILGTKATIASNSYQTAIHALLPEAAIFPVACPLFVPLVEERFFSHTAAELIVQEYLREIKLHHVDTVILGCTHYPILEPLILKELGSCIQIVNSAKACAEAVAGYLDTNRLHNVSIPPEPDLFFCSDDSEKFRDLGQELLGLQIDSVTATNFHF